jgi:hypothetical protein
MKRLFVLLLSCAAGAAYAQAEPGASAAAAPNPFAPLKWQPPVVANVPAPVAPAAPVPPAPPPAPSAPPLPFKYLGRYTADVPLVILTMGERMIVAKAGDTLDGGWRIDRFGPALIEFTYLPLQQKRSLPTGDAG